MRAPSILIAALVAGAAPAACQSASPAESQIRAMLDSSVAAWNRGDVEGHLATNADSIWFMTRNGPSIGNDKVVEIMTRNYFRGGKPIQTLSFDQLSVRPLGKRHALVVGQFILVGGGEPRRSGWFTTVWERRREGWRVIHDHSS